MFSASLRFLQLRSPGGAFFIASPVVVLGTSGGAFRSPSSSSISPDRLCRHGSPCVASSSSSCCPSSLRAQRRFLEYWGIGVTGRTQPYAKGDMFPRLDNMKNAITNPSGAAAAMTGNANNMCYDSSNIFSVKDYSAAERDHYQPLRGVDTHRIDPLPPGDAATVTAILQRLFAATENYASTATFPRPNPPDVPLQGWTLRELWWHQLFTDFPSLRTPATAEFRKAWEEFFLKAAAVADNTHAVQEMSRPFILHQLEKNFINYAMIWRITERLADALAGMTPRARHQGVVSADEHRKAKVVLERITKIALDTLASQPWAHQETTSPLHVEVSQFRAWHEAGNW